MIRCHKCRVLTGIEPIRIIIASDISDISAWDISVVVGLQYKIYGRDFNAGMVSTARLVGAGKNRKYIVHVCAPSVACHAVCHAVCRVLCHAACHAVRHAEPDRRARDDMSYSRVFTLCNETLAITDFRSSDLSRVFSPCCHRFQTGRLVPQRCPWPRDVMQ